MGKTAIIGKLAVIWVKQGRYWVSWAIIGTIGRYWVSWAIIGTIGRYWLSWLQGPSRARPIGS